MTLALVVPVKNTSNAMASSAKAALQVAVGVILREQQVLLALRQAKQHQGGKWEFPGGKIEPGETTAAALARELKEELGIQVTQSEPLLTLNYSYPERDVELDIWLVTDFTGEPKGLEGQPLQWVAVAELGQITFPDANKPIVARLQQLVTG